MDMNPERLIETFFVQSTIPISLDELSALEAHVKAMETHNKALMDTIIIFRERHARPPLPQPAVPVVDATDLVDMFYNVKIRLVVNGKEQMHV